MFARAVLSLYIDGLKKLGTYVRAHRGKWTNMVKLCLSRKPPEFTRCGLDNIVRSSRINSTTFSRLSISMLIAGKLQQNMCIIDKVWYNVCRLKHKDSFRGCHGVTERIVQIVRNNQ